MALQNDLYRVIHKTVRAQLVVEQHKVGVSKVGLNECPFQRLREGYRKVTKWTKGRSDRNLAPCSRPTTNVFGSLHECKKVCPCTKALPQSDIRAWNKQGRMKRKKERQERQRLMEREAAQQNKNTLEEVKQVLPTNS